ncbi:MAG: Flp pilus assembly protein CpaB [Ponticaulis sp.]|nr:Flp pilus assembly protein CpaB [Ponticaulis sp.]|tara:strand:+ start:2965 stop:3834 length:870 start_codon:yes stop_codon:yes gene_type:complete
MRISPAITLVASIAIGITALIAARGWLQPSQADATSAELISEKAEPETRSVVVARRAIPRGGAIDVERLGVEDWPVSSIPEDAFMTLDEVGSTEFAVRRALLPISPGQAIVESALTDAGVRPTLAARLEPGYRAFTLRMTDVTGVGGFVLPGDRIDVLFTWDQTPDSKQQVLITEVLLQDVEVLGLDLNDDLANEDPSVFQTATIAVSVTDAQKLSLAAQTGTLAFVLRGIEDREIKEFKAERLSTAPIAPSTSPKPVTRTQPRNTSNGPARVDVLTPAQTLAFNVPRS